jgi:simple sugar transport system substrate-binding protein
MTKTLETEMLKKTGCALVGLAMVAAMGSLSAQETKAIVTVVKIIGEPWFTRMAEGVKEFGVGTGTTTSTAGPAQADSAQQVRVIEDLVAKRVGAIAVVPMDPAALEGVLKRAMDRGIVVVTHEADSQVNTMADIEAFDNSAFGARLNQRLSKCMGESGKWTTFVGSVGSLTHMQWAGGGVANAKQHAKMVLVDPQNESFNDANKAYDKAKELMRKHPDIKGFQGSSAIDVLGIGRAVEEAGLQGKVCVYGIGLPKDSGKYLESGAINGISFWDPKDAGVVMNKVAKMLLDGKPLSDGMDLGVKGYNKVSVKKGAGKGVVISGQAWVDVDKSNYKQFPF